MIEREFDFELIEPQTGKKVVLPLIMEIEVDEANGRPEAVLYGVRFVEFGFITPHSVLADVARAARAAWEKLNPEWEAEAIDEAGWEFVGWNGDPASGSGKWVRR